MEVFNNTCKLLKHIILMGFLKIKTFIQLHIDSNMRIVMEGKLRLYTNSKVYSFLVISDVNKTVRYISFIMFIARNAFALHENEASQWYHMPIFF